MTAPTFSKGDRVRLVGLPDAIGVVNDPRPSSLSGRVYVRFELRFRGIDSGWFWSELLEPAPMRPEDYVGLTVRPIDRVLGAYGSGEREVLGVLPDGRLILNSTMSSRYGFFINPDCVEVIR